MWRHLLYPMIWITYYGSIWMLLVLGYMHNLAVAVNATKRRILAIWIAFVVAILSPMLLWGAVELAVWYFVSEDLNTKTAEELFTCFLIGMIPISIVLLLLKFIRRQTLSEHMKKLNKHEHVR